MNKTCVIGVDCGTQSTKAILFDLKGQIITQSKTKLRILSPYPGWKEQNSEDWWNSLCRSLKDLTDRVDPKCIAGIGIAYQREGIVIIDKKGEQIRPGILWNDQRPVLEVQEMRRELGEDFFLKTTGKFLDTLPSAIKLHWIKKNESENYKAIDKILDVGAYLNWKLTGNMTNPLAGADTSGILDIQSKKWSQPILDYLHLKTTQMPTPVPSGSVVGSVTEEASVRTGLPAGLPVVAGGGDGQVFAVGVHSLNEKQMALTLGTGAAWGLHHDTYKNSPYFRSMIGCIPDSYYFESVLISGANTITWFVQNIASEECAVSKRLNTHPEAILEKEAENIKPGCEGLLTIPYWNGAMMPYNDPNARGVTIGWSDYHGKAHLYRSILEGVAYEIRLTIDGYKSLLGKEPNAIRIGSGGAESALWNQIISDLTGKKVTLSGTVENTSSGAAMIAAWGLKYFDSLQQASDSMSTDGKSFIPNENNLNIYTKLFEEIYKHLYPAVREYSTRLGDMTLKQEI